MIVKKMFYDFGRFSLGETEFFVKRLLLFQALSYILPLHPQFYPVCTGKYINYGLLQRTDLFIREGFLEGLKTTRKAILFTSFLNRSKTPTEIISGETFSIFLINLQQARNHLSE